MFVLKLLFILILRNLGVFGMNDALKIYKNDMNKQMEQHVIGEALIITETETDLNVVAKKLANIMDNKFGKGWICLTGINTSFTGVSFNSEENAFIWFSFREKHFIVFKQAIDTVYSDPIIEARKIGAHIVMIRDEMPVNMKNWIMIMVQNAINNFNTTESISSNVVKILEGRYDYSWYCLIGSTGNDEKLLGKAANSTVLSFKIESLRITIFQVKDVVQISEKKISFKEIIEKTKSLEPKMIKGWIVNGAIISTFFLPDLCAEALNKFENESCDAAGTFIPCYQAIGDFIWHNLESKHNGKWIVAVGELNKTHVYNSHYKAYFQISIGQIYFYIQMLDV